jgi:hypothetical protein
MTTTWKSTLGAPLTEAESARILDTWIGLYHHTLALPHPVSQPEPIQMLDYITGTIMACWEVRRAIDDAWFHANKRAVPQSGSRPRPTRKLTIHNLSDEQLDALVQATNSDEQLNALVHAINSGELK